jgi:antitoxin HigA-1
MKRQPSHPGYTLKKAYLEPLDISISRMAEILDISRKTLVLRIGNLF